jgi:glycosyltransferase 2 family protein
MRKQTLSILWSTIRWGIAVVGIFYVLSKMSWHDQVRVELPNHPQAQYVRLVATGPAGYQIVDPSTGANVWVGAQDVHPEPNHPMVEAGVVHMVRDAKPKWLLAALAIFPLTIVITSLRWHELLKALDINLAVSRTFVLNMVGLFYSTFMLGSTGGDVLKAYYVAKQTHHRTRAVMSVLVDRAIGLVALIILGGTMASMQWQIHKCRQVAVTSVVLLFVTATGLIFFYNPILRKFSGLDFVISKLPMQKQVIKAIETMHIYGKRPWLAIGALVASFPVHSVVICSAMLCGFAFGLPIKPFYYWMAVPVIVLVGSIPISPQGAGVMEYFAINLLQPQGVNVGQAFALTMSIRLTQMFWNLSGAYFVFRGGYHAPSESEQEEVEKEDEDTDATLTS